MIYLISFFWSFGFEEDALTLLSKYFVELFICAVMFISKSSLWSSEYLFLWHSDL